MGGGVNALLCPPQTTPLASSAPSSPLGNFCLRHWLQALFTGVSINWGGARGQLAPPSNFSQIVVYKVHFFYFFTKEHFFAPPPWQMANSAGGISGVGRGGAPVLEPPPNQIKTMVIIDGAPP